MPGSRVGKPANSRLLGNRALFTGVVLVGFLGVIALFAPLVAPHDPDLQFEDGLDEYGMPLAPSRRFLLGTDSLGRDVLSRVCYGARISLSVGTAAMLCAAGIGVAVGMLAGYSRRWLDTLLMRFTDVMMATPAILLAMAFAGLMDGRVVRLCPAWLPLPGAEVKFERGLVGIFLVIAAVGWTGMARVVRGQVLAVKERPFVEAAVALGYSPARILWRHIFPNVLPAAIVVAATSTAWTISLEAGLSYLGVGVPPPAPTWGRMISDGQGYLLIAPWIVLSPGLAILLAILGFNLLGQGLQDVLDPHHQT